MIFSSLTSIIVKASKATRPVTHRNNEHTPDTITLFLTLVSKESLSLSLENGLILVISSSVASLKTMISQSVGYAIFQVYHHSIRFKRNYKDKRQSNLCPRANYNCRNQNFIKTYNDSKKHSKCKAQTNS